ncbi:hypothetical protein FALCPG4_017982 [Fusarium falciforme]
MPFYPELADPFLDELGKYVQWQSTLEALKNPPDTYISSPTDILGGLEMIRNTKYSSQWEFDQAIKALINSANDGHFDVEPRSFTPFTFMRNTALVSVSTDGTEAPELSYLKDIEDQAQSQDPYARYNSLFFSVPGNEGNIPYGSFAANDIYPGSSITTLEFCNGSTLEVRNIATLRSPNFEVKNGKDVFDLYRVIVQ